MTTFMFDYYQHTHTQVTMQEAEFLKNDGDPLWLKGLQHLPTKMLNLLKVNKLLAHQPWFIKPDNMKVKRRSEPMCVYNLMLVACVV